MPARVPLKAGQRPAFCSNHSIVLQFVAQKTSERRVSVQSADLWTCESGAGVPMLLCSGGPGCCDYLEPVSALIDDRAHVVRWEQRGCGRSTADGRYDLATTIADMEAIRRAYGFERWIVGGHSWGADLALAYAWHHPKRVLGLVLISGGLFVKDATWSEAYRKGRVERDELPPSFVYPPNLEVNRMLNDEWCEFTHREDLWTRAAAIACPAVWIYAENDIRPSWPERQLAALLTRAEFRLIAGAEHVIWLTHEEELKAELEAWWSRAGF